MMVRIWNLWGMLCQATQWRTSRGWSTNTQGLPVLTQQQLCRGIRSGSKSIWTCDWGWYVYSVVNSLVISCRWILKNVKMLKGNLLSLCLRWLLWLEGTINSEASSVCFLFSANNGHFSGTLPHAFSLFKEEWPRKVEKICLKSQHLRRVSQLKLFRWAHKNGQCAILTKDFPHLFVYSCQEKICNVKGR